MSKLKLIILYLILAFSTTSLYSQELNPEQIFEASNKSVVIVNSYIDSKSGKTNIGQGSGVFIDNNLVLTNYHNIFGAEKIYIEHYGKKYYDVKVVGAKVEKDLLLLRVDNVDFPSIKISQNSDYKVGSKIYAIGSPMGFENTLSEGIISGINRNPEQLIWNNMIQITSNISHGSSGGAILNSFGELIGISTYGLSENNLFFAIPIQEYKSIVQKELSTSEILANNSYFKSITIYLSKPNIYQIDIAIGLLESSLQACPNNAFGYYLLGWYYFAAGDVDSSLINYLNAIKYEPDVKWNVYDRNKFKRVSGISDSVYLYSERLISDKTDINYFNRSKLFLKLNIKQNALNDINLALAISPNNSEYIFTRAKINYNIGDYKNAEIDLETAYKLNPLIKNDYEDLLFYINKKKSKK